jgi:hypothetical protein
MSEESIAIHCLCSSSIVIIANLPYELTMQTLLARSFAYSTALMISHHLYAFRQTNKRDGLGGGKVKRPINRNPISGLLVDM